MRQIMTAIGALLSALLPASSFAQESGMGANIVTTHDRVSLAAQPSLADLDAWAEAGTRLVVNSRTPGETAGLDFDLRAEVEARGMRYAEIPIGGAYGAGPEQTAALTALLEETEGDVVMHCRSGTRSAHLYAAYLMNQDPQMSTPLDTIGWPGGGDMGMVRSMTADPR